MIFNDSTLGLIGAALVLMAFIMNQLGKWQANNFSYDLTNFTGSVILLIYATVTKAYPFAILYLVWTFVSLKDILVDIKQ